ncbi:MAG: hypothetical protein IPK82_21810 [Polyangiaceae bacterium]|nr:hypothetical protein [Polyangiaceae bacterium]
MKQNTAHVEAAEEAPGKPLSAHTGLEVDAEALLVALTLSPATYSRNRFFEMYRSPNVQHVRRRAGHLRSIVTAFVSEVGAPSRGTLESVVASTDGGSQLVYCVPRLGLRRSVVLTRIETALVRYCVGKALGEKVPTEFAPLPHDIDVITRALHRLSPVPSVAPSNETV